MCTAATYCSGDFYFGRNLDYEFSYGEHVTITPRNYPDPPARRRARPALCHDRHGAYRRTTTRSIMTRSTKRASCIAGLNFVGNAQSTRPSRQGVASVPQFELIPWLLGTLRHGRARRATRSRALDRGRTRRLRAELPCAQLHWLVADQQRLHRGRVHGGRPARL